MNSKIFREFEKICSKRNILGRVLEIGAVPEKTSLLCMKSLKNAKEKVGINIDGPYQYDDFRILQVNANRMSLFEDESFDIILCNGVFEHDKYFWKTHSEIERVAKPGALIVIGTPGYLQVTENWSFIKNSLGFRALRKLRWLSFIPPVFRSTLTLEVHNAPGDFYRFSIQAFRDVFFNNMIDVEISQIMFPPHIIGAGIKAFN